MKIKKRKKVEKCNVYDALFLEHCLICTLEGNYWQKYCKKKGLIYIYF